MLFLLYKIIMKRIFFLFVVVVSCLLVRAQNIELLKSKEKTDYVWVAAHRADFLVPTLEEFIQVAKGKVCLYLDKAGYDLLGHEEGHLVKELLKILKKHDVLEETVFVLNWPYAVSNKSSCTSAPI